MKLKRFVVFDVFDDGFRLDDDGEWCKSEDVAALEAENETLRGEMERINRCLAEAQEDIERMKAPPEVLSAQEVTEPGCYLVKWMGNKDSDWGCIRVHRGDEGVLCIDDFPVTHFSAAEFFGPLTPPEV